MTEVANPSQVLLEERIEQATGSTVAVTMEGTRPILVEVQALVSPGIPERPRRTCNGVDVNRVLLLAAVLTRRVGLKLSDQDIFVNVVGGLQIEEPAVDLAVAVALASSLRDQAVPADMVMMGEVGLSGEVRSVGQLETRLSEAGRLGFRSAVVPKRPGRWAASGPEGLKLIPVRSVGEAVEATLGPRR